MTRAYYRNKLEKLLGGAGDEEFIQLLWATDALQSGREIAAQNYIRPETIPNGAITTEMASQFSIHKWEIETLANELLTTPKFRLQKNGRTKILRWDHFGVAIDCVNWLRKLENVEYRIKNKPQDIFLELARIAGRQFSWQRGYANMPQFYRNAFVYGQGECASYFEEAHGISFSQFSKIGFILFVALSNSPMVMHDDDWTKLGVRLEELEKVLSLIAIPFNEAAVTAKRRRKSTIYTAYKPSIFRQFPCLRFGERGERLRSPLPDLIAERVTSGAFYDVVGGGGSVRAGYGRRFEEYCFLYLSHMLPENGWHREQRYGKRSNSYLTPDIFCAASGLIDVAFECKATRMSHNAIFGKNQINDRGYDDIVKAVFQLWRFFSHCRRGYVGYTVSKTAVGVVLTLDNWLLMAQPLRDRVLIDAKKMVSEKDPEIIADDRKSITFVEISELEETLSVATKSSFSEALTAASSENYAEWRLNSIHSDLFKNERRIQRKYPFATDVTRLLPWWGDFEEDTATEVS